MSTLVQDIFKGCFFIIRDDFKAANLIKKKSHFYFIGAQFGTYFGCVLLLVGRLPTHVSFLNIVELGGVKINFD